MERLKQKNSKRIQNLKNFEYAETISKIFDFTTDDLNRLTFTRYMIKADEKEVDFDNTPMEFRFFLNELFLKIRKESSDFNRSVNNERERFDLHKNLYKNYLLMDIFCLLVSLMELKNTYLSEGHFKSISYDDQKKLIKKYTSFELLEFWLNNYEYSKGKTQPLPNSEVINLLYFDCEYLYTIKCDKFGHSKLLSHKSHWKKNDLIIYDRGYPSYDFKYEHIKSGINYLIKVQKNHSKIVSSFILSEKRTLIVDVFSQGKHTFEGKDYYKTTSIEVRLIRVDLPGGEIEILMTSLLDSQIYPSNIFKELYFLR